MEFNKLLEERHSIHAYSGAVEHEEPTARPRKALEEVTKFF